jgi:hypothetical protein
MEVDGRSQQHHVPQKHLSRAARVVGLIQHVVLVGKHVLGEIGSIVVLQVRTFGLSSCLISNWIELLHLSRFGIHIQSRSIC